MKKTTDHVKPVNPDAKIETDVNAPIRFTTPEGASQTFTFESDEDWVTLIESPNGNNWISVTPAEGAGSAEPITVTINVEENDLTEERTAQITFAHKTGNKSIAVQVKQTPLLTALGYDSIVLVEFYEALEGWNWKNFPWDLDTPVQTWFGIGVGVVNGEARVTRLDIQSQNATGIIPESVAELTGLEVFMSYSNNHGGGNGFPELFTKLPRLKELYLASCNLYGPIPESYYGMTQLRQMDLSGNSITEPLSDKIGDMVNLTQLDFSNTGLKGTLPATIKNMSNLRDINVDGCRLEGPLTPELGQCPKLENLNFSSNEKITGPIPEEWGQMDSLMIILLSGCPNVTGPLPASLANCVKWWELRITGTNMGCNFPEEWINAPSLNLIQAMNCGLTGELPRWENRPKDLDYLILNNKDAIPGELNKISGTLPNFVAELNALGLENNEITGSIPECIGEKNMLRDMHLKNNKLEGDIPQNLWNIDFSQIDLSDNKGLTGTFPNEPNFWKGRRILAIGVQNCSMTGTIPEEIFLLIDLNTLLLKNNNFEGTLPKTIGRASGLSYFNLSGNKLTGEFPVEASTHDNFNMWKPATEICPQQNGFGFTGDSCEKNIE